MLRVLVILTLLTPVSSAHGQAEVPDPEGYEQRLVPLFFHGDQPSAFNSRWRVEVAGYNAGDTPVQVFQNACVYFCTCEPIMCASVRAPAHAAYVPPMDRLIPNDGVFIYVQRRFADNFTLQLRVRDVSRTAFMFGTELPIVREHEYRSSTTQLLDIPVDDRFRGNVRIYGVSNPADGGMLIVRSHDAATGAILGERTVSLRPPTPGFSPPEQSPLAPSFVLVPFSAIVPAETTGRIRLEITPLTSALRYWAFASVTNNETQHVTLVTPQ